MEGSSVKNYWT